MHDGVAERTRCTGPPARCGLLGWTLLARFAGATRHDTLLRCVLVASGTPSCGYDFRAPARLSAQRFLAASLIAFLPAALSFLLRVAGFAVGADAALTFAHLAFCAAAILRRAAALIFRLGTELSEPAAASARSPFNSWRSSAICESILRF